jgi:hypothetical protein
MSQSPYRSIRGSPPRIVGVDDGAFSSGRQAVGSTVLVVVLVEGQQILDVKVGRIEVDGLDAQRVLLSLLRPLSYESIMLSGISFGGFNLIDMRELAWVTRKPVIAVIGEKPDNIAVREALRKHFHDWRRRWRVVRAAGPLYSCKPLAEEPRLYFEVRGVSSSFAKRTIASSSLISRLPEPVRVAGVIARGLRPLS